MFHKNVSGIIFQITSAISALGINIENLTNRSKGDYSYTIFEMNGEIPDGFIDTLNKINDIIRINIIK
jgi:D-3-phosphoglycerate dehydrogenase